LDRIVVYLRDEIEVYLSFISCKCKVRARRLNKDKKSEKSFTKNIDITEKICYNKIEQMFEVIK